MIADRNVEDQTISKLLELDRDRCRAVSEGDHGRLAELLAEDLVHVHATGHHQNKRDFIETIKKSPRTSKRGEVKVRVYGDVAVMTGPQFNEMRDGERTELMVTQVWVRRDGGWQQASFHGSRAGA